MVSSTAPEESKDAAAAMIARQRGDDSGRRGVCVRYSRQQLTHQASCREHVQNSAPLLSTAKNEVTVKHAEDLQSAPQRTRTRALARYRRGPAVLACCCRVLIPGRGSYRTNSWRPA